MIGSNRTLKIDPDLLRDVRTIDVLFDGRRVWSVGVDAIRHGKLRWPEAMRKYLDGRTIVSIRDSANGLELMSVDRQFGSSERRIDFRDAAGRPLAMNKWQRLGPVFDGGEGALRERLLENSRRIVELLEREGIDTYIVGGSLLGFMRNGSLLPHDDDVDLAFLSRHSDPADIALDGYRVERILVRAGLTVVRHSLAHLEIDFFDEDGHVEHYVDVFTGYFRDGLYCQPFALRGPEVRREDLVPVQRVQVDGVSLPAPARPEAWLEYAYGPNWRIPDPSFVFNSSQWTRRRFENNFGVYNRARVYWEKFHLSLDGEQIPVRMPERIADWARSLPRHASILDIGCGTGAAANIMAATGRRVLGVDFSHEALSIAVAHAAPGTEFAYVNANNPHELFTLGARLLATGDVWYVRLDDVLHGLTLANRESLFLFLELVLRGGAVAVGTTYTNLPASYQRGDPTSWHFPEEWFEIELADRSLGVEIIERRRRRTPHGRRNEVEFVIRPDGSTSTENGDER